MQNLSDNRTRLGRLLESLENAASIVAPVAQTQADLFVNLDTTFSALSAVRGDIQDSIEGGPPALDAAIEGFPRQRPFLANSQALFHELRPGVRALRTAAPVLADAFEDGTRTLPRTVALNARLTDTFNALVAFAENPNTSSPGPPAECEAGNEDYLPGRTVIGNVPGTQSQSTEKTKASLTD
jgi:ABC-type transporter Mla subunit MlaD